MQHCTNAWLNMNMHLSRLETKPELRQLIVPAIRHTLRPDDLSDVDSASLDMPKKDDAIVLPVEKGRTTVFLAKPTIFKNQRSS